MELTVLQPREKLNVDPDRITELYVRFGESGAEERICASMETLAHCLCDLQGFRGKGKKPVLREMACNIGELASGIGLVALAQVALDFEYCLHFDDYAATEATFARLMRVSRISLAAIWDQQDLSV